MMCYYLNVHFQGQRGNQHLCQCLQKEADIAMPAGSVLAINIPSTTYPHREGVFQKNTSLVISVLDQENKKLRNKDEQKLHSFWDVMTIQRHATSQKSQALSYAVAESCNHAWSNKCLHPYVQQKD